MCINQVFTLSMVLDTNEFNRVFSSHNLLETDGEEYIDPSFTHKGITILYRNSQYKKKIRLIVNSANAIKLTNKFQKKEKSLDKGKKMCGKALKTRLIFRGRAHEIHS